MSRVLVRKILEELGHKVSSMEEQLIADLGMDSLGTLELLMAIEEETEREIADDSLNYLKTVQDVQDFVDRLQGIGVVRPPSETTLVLEGRFVRLLDHQLGLTCNGCGHSLMAGATIITDECRTLTAADKCPLGLLHKAFVQV